MSWWKAARGKHGEQGELIPPLLSGSVPPEGGLEAEGRGGERRGGGLALEGNTATSSRHDDGKQWLNPAFPLVRCGDVNVYNPDGAAKANVKGRSTDIGNTLASCLLTLGPVQTLMVGISAYFAAVLTFALAYLEGGDTCVNADKNSFRVSLYLSCHTMSTVGYGSLYTTSDYCTFVMLFQSFCNIALVAIITSALFINFSRPNPKLEFSNKAVVYHCPSEADSQKMTFSFQFVKKSAISMLNANVQAVLWDYTNFPEIKRTPLELDQPTILYLDYACRISHEVCSASPLRHFVDQAMTSNGSRCHRDDIQRPRQEWQRCTLSNAFHIVVTLTAVSACTGVDCTRMYVYTHENIFLRKKFVPELHGEVKDASSKSSELINIDLNLVHSIEDEHKVNETERRSSHKLLNVVHKVQKLQSVVNQLRAVSAFSSPRPRVGEPYHDEADTNHV